MKDEILAKILSPFIMRPIVKMFNLFAKHPFTLYHIFWERMFCALNKGAFQILD